MDQWTMEPHDGRGQGTPIYRRSASGMWPRIALVTPIDTSGPTSDELAQELIDAANGYEMLKTYLVYAKHNSGFSGASIACYQMGRHEKCLEYEACDCSCHYDDERFPQSERPPEGYREFMATLT